MVNVTGATRQAGGRGQGGERAPPQPAEGLAARPVAGGSARCRTCASAQWIALALNGRPRRRGALVRDRAASCASRVLPGRPVRSARDRTTCACSSSPAARRARSCKSSTSSSPSVVPTVHVTGRVPERVHDALAESFTLVDDLEGADGILSLLTTRVDGKLLDRAGPQLRVVANYGVGVDNVDLDAARSRDVLVANTPDVLTDAVAELDDRVDARAAPPRRGRRPLPPQARTLGVLAGVHARRDAARQDVRRRRAGADRSRRRGARRRPRRSCLARRARRRPRRSARDGRRRQPPRSAEPGDAAPDRLRRASTHAALGRMRRSSSEPIRRRVSGLSGTWRLTTSAVASNESRPSPRPANDTSAEAFGERRGGDRSGPARRRRTSCRAASRRA